MEHNCLDGNFFIAKDFFSDEFFRINYCYVCCHGKTIVSKNFNPDKYYPPEIYTHKNKKKFAFPFSLVYEYFRTKRAKIFSNNFPDKNIHLLDVGCGNGSFLYSLKERGYEEIYGTELSEFSSAYAKGVIGNERIFAEIKDVQKFVKTFDCVTFWHTLEHFEDDHGILESAHNVLAKKGKILIEVPNFSSLQAWIDRKYWVYNEVPRHMQHYSTKSLVDRLAQHGFSVNKINTFSAEFGFFGMFSSLCNLICGKNIPLKILLRQYNGISVPQLLFFLLVAPFIFIVAIPIELVATLFGYGSVIYISASKIEA